MSATAEEEQSSFHVVLTAAGDKKIQGVDRAEADKLKAELEEAGGPSS